MPVTLQKISSLVLTVVLLCTILIYARSFLIPIFLAIQLSLLLIPFAKSLERKRIHPVIATLASVLILLLILAGFVLFLRWQIAHVIEDAGKIEEELRARFQELRNFISEHFGITITQQQQIIDEQSRSVQSQAGTFLVSNVGTIGSLVTDLVLVIVYTFLFIHYRQLIKEFIISLVPEKEKNNTEEVLERSQEVAFRYLKGMGLMITALWVMYGLGFSLAGVKHPLFFAVLCGVLEIIPFVGNLTGSALTVLMSLAQGGSSGMIIGIIITYSSIQFIQSYLLEPLIVGAGVRINPLFTILSLVAGEFLWGIAGMILALPMVGILKVIFEHIRVLQPVGHLVGNGKVDTD